MKRVIIARNFGGGDYDVIRDYVECQECYDVKITSDDIIEFILVAIKEKADITPRSIIRDFIEVLNLSFQNGNASIKQIMDTFKYSDDVENLEDIEE